MIELKFINILLILIIIYLFFILYNKKNCNNGEIIPTRVVNSVLNPVQRIQKKNAFVLPTDLLNLIKLSIEEVEKSKELSKENPTSAIIICKKILEDSSQSPLLINSLKTILKENTLTSRYLLETRFYLEDYKLEF